MSNKKKRRSKKRGAGISRFLVTCFIILVVGSASFAMGVYYDQQVRSQTVAVSPQ